MPRHGDFAVWMRCNDQCMDEHAVRAEGNVVTVYVASEAGQVCCKAINVKTLMKLHFLRVG